jgi:hypothetical protein
MPRTPSGETVKSLDQHNRKHARHNTATHLLFSVTSNVETTDSNTAGSASDVFGHEMLVECGNNNF